ncbi:GNAT family N-acetyltransferase [Thiomicrorhabdus xiamenensis]|uniref:GNAT family N-acetyltransferase n=1 Tax=Thiomicrorhabdus xiamenensis TaxID=2739063 RepID=A0A7D4TH99_9GAMM|nr:GNAT family N-acetyltransferase [Thiomicrorhabdus xiamenensis]QKI90148.1 GNAT family N-acetyltransferase [Thiomicrorhabdus xiamenensis]
MSISIQHAQRQNIAQMTELLRILFSIEADFEFAPEKHRSALQKIIEQPDCGALVALDGDELIGMCTAQWVYSTATGQKSAWIEDVIVHPEYQGKGIGTQLMNALKEWCRENGCNRMQLVYDLENRPAIDFYRNQGFTNTRLGVFSKAI